MQRKKLMFEYQNTFWVGLKSCGYSFIWGFCLCCFLVFWFVFSYGYYNIIGDSMQPNLYERTINYLGDACYINYSKKFTYGDIVVAHSSQKKDIIKRVIAMGGDKVGYYYNDKTTFYETLVLFKGQETPTRIDESYITKNVPASEVDYYKEQNEYSYDNFELYVINSGNFYILDETFNGSEVKMLKLEDDEVYLLGDNRQYSIDCSSYGPIKIDNIFGCVELIVQRGSLNFEKILLHWLGF